MSRAECLSPLASNESECLYWLAPLDLVVFRPISSSFFGRLLVVVVCERL